MGHHARIEEISRLDFTATLRALLPSGRRVVLAGQHTDLLGLDARAQLARSLDPGDILRALFRDLLPNEPVDARHLLAELDLLAPLTDTEVTLTARE